jgi:Protein of unknown function (DUF3108)
MTRTMPKLWKTIASAACTLAFATGLPAAGGQTRRPAAAATARAERPVPFKAGEALAFDVAWSSYLTAGTATVTVREKRLSFDSVAYHIVAEGRPTALLQKLYTLYYKADTLLDAHTLLPQRGSVYSEEGTRRRTKTLRFDQTHLKASYEVTTATVVKQDLVLPAVTQDVLSALYVLRALPLKAGGRLTMAVADDGQVYRVQIAVAGVEQVTTPLGTLPAWHLTPVIMNDKGKQEGRALHLWISDDARRLPLKLEADLAVGKFHLVLRQARG